MRERTHVISMAEAGTGFFHAWSQDTYLNTKMGDSSDICFAVAAIWIQQRYLAREGGQAQRRTFLDFFYTESALEISLELQGEHDKALSKHWHSDPKIIVAARFSPALEYLAKSGVGKSGATVTTDLGVVSEFVTEYPGYYLIGAHGPDAGHAFAGAASNHAPAKHYAVRPESWRSHLEFGDVRRVERSNAGIGRPRRLSQRRCLAHNSEKFPCLIFGD